jgi:hypothetical protein
LAHGSHARGPAGLEVADRRFLEVFVSLKKVDTAWRVNQIFGSRLAAIEVRKKSSPSLLCLQDIHSS